MTVKKKARAAGVLLHPSSLPSPYGIGDLGPSAYAWIDALVHAKQKYWQILPLGPTSFGDSPYQCFSAFAGNPYLVSPYFLVEDGLLDIQDLDASFAHHFVDYGPVIAFKNRILAKAWANFQAGRAGKLRAEFEAFQSANHDWLDDFALFMALKDAHQGRSWTEWDVGARLRDPGTLEQARKVHAETLGLHRFRHFLFFRQWQGVKEYAASRGIGVIGDIPIFVALDSADVWANPHLFLLNSERRPTCVAGVPPDYFSETGQLWGNPLYDWNALEKSGFSWWLARFRACLKLVDRIRVDHFRGFESYWEVPAHEPTAIHGKWVKAPGRSLFETVQRELGEVPIIAEDLGIITPEVDALRTSFNLPGMRVLHFAFGDKPNNPYLPHNYEANTVVYTGTHDNDTTVGWYQTAPDHVRDHVRRYLARDGSDIAWDFIRVAWSSVADLAVVPLQDILSLGTEARMNFPGKPQGNWGWRYQPHQLHPWALDRLAELTILYGRTETADGH